MKAGITLLMTQSRFQKSNVNKDKKIFHNGKDTINQEDIF